MPTTLTATPEPGNVPPRILLQLTYTGQTSATIVRTDPDGSQTPVRLAEPAALDGSGSWVGYDYESWFGGATTYTATTTAGNITSTPVTLDVTDIWLRHPGVPSLSQKVDFWGEGDPIRAVAQAVLEPLGRATPIVVSDGRRKSKRGDLSLRTQGDAQHVALLALFDDLTPLLLDVPPGKAFGADLTHQYLSLGDLTQKRLVDGYYHHPDRVWTAPYIVVGRPAGGIQAQRTYATVLGAHLTYQSLIAQYGSYTNLLTGAALDPTAPEFTFLRKTSPDRTEVYDNAGLAATFTDGCLTAVVRGPVRTFTDSFKPYADVFAREITAGHGTAPGAAVPSFHALVRTIPPAVVSASIHHFCPATNVPAAARVTCAAMVLCTPERTLSMRVDTDPSVWNAIRAR